jgi:hypothetical protein
MWTFWLLALLSGGSTGVDAVTTTPFIALSQTCYERRTRLDLVFQNDNPTDDDWIAIVPPATDMSPFTTHVVEHWVNTCGTQFCNGQALSSGEISLRSRRIPDGSWKAILVSPGPNSWVGIAESNVFDLVPIGDCPPEEEVLEEVETETTPAPSFAPPPPPEEEEPSLSPTRSDGLSITTENEVITDKVMYALGEPIVLTFTSTAPRNDDWVAIYPDSVSSNNLRQGELWQWVCGGQESGGCSTTLAQGTVQFNTGTNISDEDWAQSWPLLPGTYRAYLLRDTGQPYEAVTESSAVFTVMGTPSPTGSPTVPSVISTDAQTYLAGDVITVSFQNGDPMIGDWIAIFEASAPLDNLQNGELWMWICGGQADVYPCDGLVCF